MTSPQLTPYSMVKKKKQKTFLLRSGKRQCPFLLLSFKILMKILARAIREKKRVLKAYKLKRSKIIQMTFLLTR